MSRVPARCLAHQAEAKVVIELLEVTSGSADQTRHIGGTVGQAAMPGDVILLEGKLGAGKTCLTQGIAAGLGIDDYVVSPSFVLVREYRGRLPLYHIDFYRLDTIEEVAELGLDDYLCGPGVCVVEWAEKGLAVLPSEHLLIQMQHVAPTKRKLRLLPRGPRYVQMLSQVERTRRIAGR